MAEGYKAFTGGEVLEAEDLTDYASSQAVMRFANAAGRDAALTVSVVKEGMLAYLKDTNVLTVNTDGTTTGWKQIYPVVTATIDDNQVTNAKLAANSVTTGNIVDGTIVGSDIASGTITGANIQDGSIGPSDLAGGTYGINISGNAATATSATSASSATTAGFATNAGNADTLDGYNTSTGSVADTVAVRSGAGALEAFSYTATGGSIGAFRDTGTYTYIGFGTARVVNSTDVYSQPVSGRTVLISSNLTLGTSTSSIRWKEDIAPLDYSARDILKMNPIFFRYKADHLEPGSDRPLEVGLVAEQLAELGFDEVIFRGKDGQPDGIAYERLAVLVLKVCQEQQTQIDALSARLDALEANNAN